MLKLSLPRSHISLIADNAGAAQMLDASMSISNLTVANRATLEVYGSIKAYGHIDVNDATLAIDADATLTLGEDEMGRATILRKNGGNVLGELTREIYLAAKPNRDMTLLQQRITIGLENVTVAEFADDIPTWGFDGATVSEGWPNIRFKTSESNWNFEYVSNINDTLPVFEGVVIVLNTDTSYNLTFTGTLPSNDYAIDLDGTQPNIFVGNGSNAVMSLIDFHMQFDSESTSLSCWNTKTLQYDHYIDGQSTNAMMGHLEPNTACEFRPSGVNQVIVWL